MYTLGYSFRPWTDAKAIADGPSILQLRARDGRASTASTRTSASGTAWCAPSGRLDRRALDGRGRATRHGRDRRRCTCGFLFMCTGYYRYDEGYTPEFAGSERFAGRIVHPQHWPEDLDYAGKRVVVIGSGATAVTLVPGDGRDAPRTSRCCSARRATSSRCRPRTRSPTRCAACCRRSSPTPSCAGRTCSITHGVLPAQPAPAASCVKAHAPQGRRAGSCRPGYDVDTHFKPALQPVGPAHVPGARTATSSRRSAAASASVVTDHIETFTEKRHPARVRRGARGRPRRHRHRPEHAAARRHGARRSTASASSCPRPLSYKGMMLSGVPEHGDRDRLHQRLVDAQVRPHLRVRLPPAQPHGRARLRAVHAASAATRRGRREPIIDFSSGYVQRAIDQFPKQGSKAPWRLYQNYPRDLRMLRYGAIEDGRAEVHETSPGRGHPGSRRRLTPRGQRGAEHRSPESARSGGRSVIGRSTAAPNQCRRGNCLATRSAIRW